MNTKYTIYDGFGKGVFNARSAREIYAYLKNVAGVKVTRENIEATTDYLKGKGGKWLEHSFGGYTIDMCKNTVNLNRVNIPYDTIKEYFLFMRMCSISVELHDLVLTEKDYDRKNEIYNYLMGRFKLYMVLLAEKYQIHTEVRTELLKGYRIPTVEECFELEFEDIPTSQTIDIYTPKV